MSPSKKPGVRLAIYEKLLHRLFEVLILASFIKRVHGSHITANHDLSTTAGARRRFLKNLTFLCDYDKGGPSTTGICVEDRHDCYVTWLASNEGVSSGVITFLESVLDNLRAAPSGKERQSQETSLLQIAATFARNRVFKEWKILVRSAIKSLAVLDKVGDQGNRLCMASLLTFKRQVGGVTHVRPRCKGPLQATLSTIRLTAPSNHLMRLPAGR
ncbi:hypothetical protein EDB80DRAFT_782648 [Ilyonectria destructans]|nr:hypothetical protein EDB80DRAFT_782648 [Ilyonectria destructans]